MAATFTLLHLSDLHVDGPLQLEEPPKSRLSQLLAPKQTVERIWRHLRRCTFSESILEHLVESVRGEYGTLDIALISGDLVHLGNSKPSERARTIILNGPPLKEERSRQFPIPRFTFPDSKGLVIVPGNHDRYQNAFGTPGSTELERIFPEYWSDKAGVKDGVRVISRRKEGQELSLICGDLTFDEGDHPNTTGMVSTVRSRWGRGRAHKDVRDEMVRRSDEEREQGRSVIWVVHFPPHFPFEHDSLNIPPDEIKKYRTDLELEDSSPFVDAAESAGISYILAGHTHFQHSYPVRQNMHVLTAGAATCLEKGCHTSYQIVKFSVDGERVVASSIDEFHFELSAGQFVSQPILS